ncbi:MAG: hypothetical protein RBT46_09290 [Weeksellaceae bacterium]|jgi:hypothetical protein|nr:hypothetical protein [Weeksellaceae bacterium]MDX9705883.1 hypothetical protein [Weeksellaceae bacterium]
MTLDEYYKEREALSEELTALLESAKRPFTKEYNSFTISAPFKQKEKELREQLSPEDLAIVNDRDRNWQRKVQSSIG